MHRLELASCSGRLEESTLVDLDPAGLDIPIRPVIHLDPLFCRPACVYEKEITKYVQMRKVQLHDSG
jgi:hypothetical protein